MRVRDCKSKLSNRETLPILMLVPHEPDEDPRVKWVIDLCAQVGRTDVIGFTTVLSERPDRSFDGTVFVDRQIAFSTHKPSTFFRVVRFLFGILGLLIKFKLPLSIERIPGFIKKFLHNPRKALVGSTQFRTCIAFAVRISGLGQEILLRLERQAKALNDSENISITCNHGTSPTEKETTSFSSSFKQWSFLQGLTSYLCPRIEHSSIKHLFVNLEYFSIISRALYKRSRSISLVPRVIICHDIYALLAGVKLKKLFGCRLLYDSHELWPAAFLQARNWETKVIALIERRAIKHADAVITVTPQIARHLESLYNICGVRSVPNAEPMGSTIEPPCYRKISYPIKFLLQGRVVPGRGVEELLHAWSLLKNIDAVLIMRVPANDYVRHLCSKFIQFIEKKQIILVPPVKETDLVSAASFADVGLVPYPGPCLNHLYACPNKLSQYLQAGLAIVCNADLEFVSEIVKREQCGFTYRASDPDTFIEAAKYLVGNPELLQKMKNRAYQYAFSEFNWQKQSAPYKDAIVELSQECQRI